MADTSQLIVYAAALVNPYKLAILLEELGTSYSLQVLEYATKDHKSPEYLKINPNGKVPALTDERGGKKFVVWESAACLQYLADQYDVNHNFSFERGTPEYYTMLSWLSWQISGLAPSMGQAAHFMRYATEDVPYGKTRYIAECRRLFNIMEQQLKSSSWDFLVDNKYSIADIACYPWVITAYFVGVDIDDFPAVKMWRDRIAQRDAVKKAMVKPAPFYASDENMKKPEVMEMFQTTIRPMVAETIRQETQEWTKAAASK